MTKLVDVIEIKDNRIRKLHYISFPLRLNRHAQSVISWQRFYVKALFITQHEKQGDKGRKVVQRKQRSAISASGTSNERDNMRLLGMFFGERWGESQSHFCANILAVFTLCVLLSGVLVDYECVKGGNTDLRVPYNYSQVHI